MGGFLSSQTDASEKAAQGELAAREQSEEERKEKARKLMLQRLSILRRRGAGGDAGIGGQADQQDLLGG